MKALLRMTQEAEPDVEELNFYVCNDTDILHDVKFFPTFVILRALSASFYEIKRLDYPAFNREYHEYLGDTLALREMIEEVALDDEDILDFLETDDD